MVKRILTLLVLTENTPPKQVASTLRCSVQSVYIWLREFMVKGYDSLQQTKSSGKRKGYKIFRLISYTDEKFFSAGIEGRFNSESYISFLKDVFVKNNQHIILIQDGARYHVSKQTNGFFQDNKELLTVYQLPNYSPDYNPIEKLWKKIKESHIHIHYFPTFEDLKKKAQEATLKYEDLQNEVLALFGFYRKIEITKA